MDLSNVSFFNFFLLYLMFGIHWLILIIIFVIVINISLFFPIKYSQIRMNYNNFHFKKLLTKPINDTIKEITEAVQILTPIKNDSYKRHAKFTIYDYVVGIIDVMKNYTSWNAYNGIIPGNTLRKKHSEWTKLGIYEAVHKSSLNKYLKTTKRTEELKYQSIDSTFVRDINGSEESNYSGTYKCRKSESALGISVTEIVTTKGIPLSISIDGANKYDSTLLPAAIDNIVINCDTKKYKNHNRFKQYLLADKGYDSKENHKLCIKKGYTPLIAQNRRNIKNKKLLRKMNTKQKNIYKKRHIIENYHSWIKKMAKINCLYERNIHHYKGLLLLGISIIINRRIVKNIS